MTKKSRLLYVDDEPINVVFFELNFKSDFDVITAKNGQEGLDILARQPVDFIVSDYKMPGLNGVDFLKTAHEKYGRKPSIILSGYDKNEHIIEALEAEQIVAYLTKPMDRNMILNIIKNQLPDHF